MQLARETCPPEYPKRGAMPYLAAQLNIHPSVLSPWRNGKYRKNSQAALSEGHFQNLITYFWRCPHNPLKDLDDIYTLAAAAGEEYTLYLHKEWFLKLVEGHKAIQLPPPPERDHYPRSRWLVARQSLQEQICLQARYCLVQRAPLVIYGPPGIGKSTLIDQLAAVPEARTRFGERILIAHLNGGSHNYFLHQWLRQLTHRTMAILDSEEKIAADLKSWLGSKPAMLLIDDVSEARHAERLMLGDPQTCLAIITTRSLKVAETLASNRECLLYLDGFTDSQAHQLYERGWMRSGDLAPQAKIAALNQLLKGNPLALHFAFHLVERSGKPRWQDTLALLSAKSQYLPPGFLEEVYWPQKLLYEQVLSPDLQTNLRAVGALPLLRSYHLSTFMSLWNVPEAGARYILERLCDLGGWIVQEDEENWSIHGQALAFAAQMLAKESAEQNFAAGWEDRCLMSPITQKRLGHIMERELAIASPLECLRHILAHFPNLNLANLRWLIHIWRGPKYSIEWEDYQHVICDASSDEYLIGRQLYARQIPWNYLCWFIFAPIPLFLIIGFLFSDLKIFMVPPLPFTTLQVISTSMSWVYSILRLLLLVCLVFFIVYLTTLGPYYALAWAELYDRAKNSK